MFQGEERYYVIALVNKIPSGKCFIDQVVDIMERPARHSHANHALTAPGATKTHSSLDNTITSNIGDEGANSRV